MSWDIRIQDPADVFLDRERWEATQEHLRELREREALLNEDDYVGRDEE